jgi:hypothetical protein
MVGRQKLRLESASRSMAGEVSVILTDIKDDLREI